MERVMRAARFLLMTVMSYLTIYEEVEKETGKKNSAGCPTGVLVTISAFGCLAIFTLWIIG